MATDQFPLTYHSACTPLHLSNFSSFCPCYLTYVECLFPSGLNIEEVMSGPVNSNAGLARRATRSISCATETKHQMLHALGEVVFHSKISARGGLVWRPSTCFWCGLWKLRGPKIKLILLKYYITHCFIGPRNTQIFSLNNAQILIWPPD